MTRRPRNPRSLVYATTIGFSAFALLRGQLAWLREQGWDVTLVTSPDELAGVKFDAGSMGPKVEASCEFVKATGGMVGIGALDDGLAILKGEAGTNIVATRTVNA